MLALLFTQVINVQQYVVVVTVVVVDVVVRW